MKKSSIITVFCCNHKNISSPPRPLKQSGPNPIFIQSELLYFLLLDTKNQTLMCKLNAALTHAQILYTLLLHKCLIPPKTRSLQSFLKLKKLVFHTPISLSLFLFIYIDLDSTY